MSHKLSVKVGDWVRWMSNGTLCLGVVEYVRPQESYPWGLNAYTSGGVIAVDKVLESRAPLSPQEEPKDGNP